MTWNRSIILLTLVLRFGTPLRSGPLTAMSDAILHDDVTLLNSSATPAQVVISSHTDFTLHADVHGSGTATALHTLSFGLFSFSQMLNAPPSQTESFTISSPPSTLIIPPHGSVVVSTSTEAKAEVTSPALSINDFLEAFLRKFVKFQFSNTSAVPVTISHDITASYSLSLSGTAPPLITGSASITSGPDPMFSDELTSDGARTVPLNFTPPSFDLPPSQSLVEEFAGSVEAKVSFVPEPSMLSLTLICLSVITASDRLARYARRGR